MLESQPLPLSVSHSSQKQQASILILTDALLQRIATKPKIDKLQLLEKVIRTIGPRENFSIRDKVGHSADILELVCVFRIWSRKVALRLDELGVDKHSALNRANFEIGNNRPQGNRTHRHHLLERTGGGAPRGAVVVAGAGTTAAFVVQRIRAFPASPESPRYAFVTVWTDDAFPSNTRETGISIFLWYSREEIRDETILWPNFLIRGLTSTQKARMVGQIAGRRGAIDAPELGAGRLETHPTFVIYARARHGAFGTDLAFRRQEFSLAHRRRIWRPLGGPPTSFLEVQLLEADLCAGPLAHLLVPYMSDAEVAHHVISMRQLPPQHGVTIPWRDISRQHYREHDAS